MISVNFALVARNARANRNVLGNTQATTPTLSIVIFLFLSEITLFLVFFRRPWICFTHCAAGGADWDFLGNSLTVVEELPLRHGDRHPRWPLHFLKIEMSAQGRSLRISNPKLLHYSWSGACLVLFTPD